MKKILCCFLVLLGSMTAYGESLTRSYETTAAAPAPEGKELIAQNPVAPSVSQTAVEPLDMEHRDAILDALMAPMGMPGPVNHAVNCFVRAQGNGDLYIVAKYVKEGCGIEEIELIFDYFDTLDIPSARNLIVTLLTGLVKEINGNHKIAKFFSRYPIDDSQIVIRVRVRPPNCGLSYPAIGNIASIMVANGVISYGTLNSYSREIDYLRIEPLHQALLFVKE